MYTFYLQNMKKPLAQVNLFKFVFAFFLILTSFSTYGQRPPQFVGISDAVATEGSEMTFTILASRALNRNVNYTITYFATVDNSVDNADIQGITTVTMLAGETEATFNVLAIDDDFVETTEEFFVVQIETNRNIVVILRNQGVGTVIDPDIALIQAGDFDVTEGGVIQYNINLAQGTDANGQEYAGLQNGFQLNFFANELPTSDSPATAGSDFPGSFVASPTFAPGAAVGDVVTIPVPTLEDNLVEPSEEFQGLIEANRSESDLYLDENGVSRVRVDTEGSSLRIHDNDTATITLQNATENENTGNFDYAFTLAGETRDSFQIGYQTTVSFNGTDGEVRTTQFSLINDVVREETETYNILPTYNGVVPSFPNALAQNIVFANNTGTVTILDDDLEAVDDIATIYQVQRQMILRMMLLITTHHSQALVVKTPFNIELKIV